MLSRAAGTVTTGRARLADLAAACGSAASAEEVAEALSGAGAGVRDGDAIEFSAGDRLRCAVGAIKAGADIGEVSELVDWRDFEGLAAEVLLEREYEVTRNLILRRPRAEIDVVGRKGDTAVLLDCKHWRRPVPRSAAARQAARAQRYAGLYGVRRAVPAIVTLYEQGSGGVPAVPIWQLGSFLDGMHGNLDQVTIISPG